MNNIEKFDKRQFLQKKENMPSVYASGYRLFRDFMVIIMGKRAEKRRLREEWAKEQKALDAVKLPTKNVSLREFRDFVVGELVSSLNKDDKQFLIEHQNPMYYSFTSCRYIMNYYIANYTTRGYKFTDLPDDGYDDHFRENFSVELMYEIIKAVCQEANVSISDEHKPLCGYL